MTTDRINFAGLYGRDVWIERHALHGDAPAKRLWVQVEVNELERLLAVAEAARALFDPASDLADPLETYQADPHGLEGEIMTLADALARFDFSKVSA